MYVSNCSSSPFLIWPGTAARPYPEWRRWRVAWGATSRASMTLATRQCHPANISPWFRCLEYANAIPPPHVGERAVSPNPYQSPSDNALTANAKSKRRKWLTYAALVGWLVFFLLPSFGVIAGHVYPEPPSLDAPTADTVLSRVSLALGVPLGPLLLGSLLGCAVAAACLPIALRWKAAAMIAWIPLAALQVLALVLALVLLGYPPVT